MRENALELEPEPELLALQFRLQRMLEVVSLVNKTMDSGNY